MKDKKNIILRILCLIFVTVFMSGCTTTFFTGFDTQSHFEYPNSNIIPLGKTIGEATTTSISFYPLFKTAELEEEAVNNALKQKGGDILINYMVFEKRTDIMFIHTLTLRVEGTAAKMKIGTQKLY